jgi:inosine/xanthosine triphosphatase
MKVVLGSTNPVKARAVENVFRRVYGEASVESVAAASGVPSQPFGEETVTGAINRAKSAFAPEKYDVGVGIEAGLFKISGEVEVTIDVQYCAIYDGSWLTLGCGSGFEYPPAVLGEVLSGKEVGDVMSRLAGIENLGEKQGAIGVLSMGMLNRTQLTEQSVFMALIPRMNPGLYGR